MNNHKVQKIGKPINPVYLIVMAVFAVAGYFFNHILGILEGIVLVILLAYSAVRARRRQKELTSFVESVTYNTESATNNTLIHFPLPMAVFRLEDSTIVWANQPFWAMCGRKGPAFDVKMSSLVPDFSSKWLLEGRTQLADLTTVGDKRYQVNGNMVRSGSEETAYEIMGITYWVDVTEYEAIKTEYGLSRPVVMVIIVDNYEELMKPLSDRQRSELRGLVDGAIEKWCEGRGGIMRRFDRDRYLFIFEYRHLPEIIASKFDLVESIHSIVNSSSIYATVSLGVGVDGESFGEDYSFASLAADMALSRGGDQAVIKNKFNFEFFGGRGTEVETRSKVKSRVMASALARLIQDAGQVLIMGHRYGDLDSLGASVGIACIARALGSEARIVVNEDRTAALSLLRYMQEDENYKNKFISTQEALLLADKQTLLVVVDTHRPEQVEDESLLTACSNRLAVIDHHRRAPTYIQNATMTLYEPNASSTCELVTELMEELIEQKDILPCEADAVMAGLVLDTKNFTLRTGERTFDAAAVLRRVGADTVRVKRLFQNGLESTIQRYDILKTAELYKGIAVAAAAEKTSRVVAAQAADELLNISGVDASAVVYAMDDGSIAISARSIGDTNVQVLLETLGGGGNRSAAGCQLRDVTPEEARDRLCAAIDHYRDTE